MTPEQQLRYSEAMAVRRAHWRRKRREQQFAKAIRWAARLFKTNQNGEQNTATR